MQVRGKLSTVARIATNVYVLLVVGLGLLWLGLDLSFSDSPMTSLWAWIPYLVIGLILGRFVMSGHLTPPVIGDIFVAALWLGLLAVLTTATWLYMANYKLYVGDLPTFNLADRRNWIRKEMGWL